MLIVNELRGFNFGVYHFLLEKARKNGRRAPVPGWVRSLRYFRFVVIFFCSGVPVFGVPRRKDNS